MDRKSAARLGGLQKGINYRKQKHKALYSEPQVCPKPEQMMICPVETCFRKCEAKKPHQRNVSCEMECAAGYIAPCNIIPVPSTPASEGMLTSAEKMCLWATKLPEKATDREVLYGVVLNIANYRIAKATPLIEAPLRAEIAELKSQLESCVNTLKERDNQLEKAEAKIKELEKKLELTSVAEDIVRADQNRKIGEGLDTHKAYYLALVEAIAKLQKGETPSK